MFDDESDHRRQRADRLIELHAKLAVASAQFRVGFHILSDATSVAGTSPTQAKALAGLDQMLADTSCRVGEIIDRALADVAEMIRDGLTRPD